MSIVILTTVKYVMNLLLRMLMYLRMYITLVIIVNMLRCVSVDILFWDGMTLIFLSILHLKTCIMDIANADILH